MTAIASEIIAQMETTEPKSSSGEVVEITQKDEIDDKELEIRRFNIQVSIVSDICTGYLASIFVMAMTILYSRTLDLGMVLIFMTALIAIVVILWNG